MRVEGLDILDSGGDSRKKEAKVDGHTGLLDCGLQDGELAAVEAARPPNGKRLCFMEGGGPPPPFGM